MRRRKLALELARETRLFDCSSSIVLFREQSRRRSSSLFLSLERKKKEAQLLTVRRAGAVMRCGFGELFRS